MSYVLLPQLTKVWLRLSMRPYVCAWEQWASVVAWWHEQQRLQEMSDRLDDMLAMQHGWGVQRMVAALKRNYSRAIRHAFRLWADAAQQAQHNDVIVKRVYARWQRAGQVRCFNRLAEHGKQRRRARFLARKVFGRMANAKAAAGWASWCDSVVEMNRQRAVLAWEARRMQQHRANMAFGRWTDYTEEKKRMKYLVR